MSRTIADRHQQFLDEKLRFLTKLWRIERADGTFFHFTSHDAIIEFKPEGEKTFTTFAPAGGFSRSATQMNSQAESLNAEARGVITSDLITHSELFAGFYNDAVITEWTVDWRVPWAGAISTRVFWLTNVNFTGEVWAAELDGLGYKLRPVVGRSFERTCEYELGFGFGDDTCAGCKINIDSYRDTGKTVLTADTRERFNISTSRATSYYKGGTIEWHTGANAGLKMSILDNDASDWFTLNEPCPYDPVAGDVCDLIIGCDGTLGTCVGVFSNVLNYGGFPFLYGETIFSQVGGYQGENPEDPWSG